MEHAIEAVGRREASSTVVKVLRRGGTATILGMMPLAETVGLSALDLLSGKRLQGALMGANRFPVEIPRLVDFYLRGLLDLDTIIAERSEAHTSELQSLMRISYAVFCLKTKNHNHKD